MKQLLTRELSKARPVLPLTGPEVSIITPLYNGDEFFRETVDSVRAQTFTDFEWVIVNDNSDDGTHAYLERLAGEDSRVKVITFTENRGPIQARNAAMSAATGRFVAFLDGDDLWLPNKLEFQIDLMKREGSHLSYTAYRKINREGELKTGFLVQVPDRSGYWSILQSDCMMASSVVFDREITGRILQSPDSPIGKDDFHFLLSILEAFGPAHGINEDLARLRCHGESLTGNKLVSAVRQWRFYRRTLGLPRSVSLVNFAVYSVKGLMKHLFY